MPRRALLLAAVATAGCGDDRGAPTVDAAPAAPLDLLLGGPAGDDLLDLVLVDGDVIVAGYRGGALGGNLEPDGPAVGVIARYAADGTPRWERTFDTAAAEAVDALWLDDRGLAFAGRTGGALPGATPAGQHDAFVGVLDLDGRDVVAPVQFGDARPQHPTRLARDGTGALLVAGYEDVYIEGGAVIAAENPWTARIVAAGGLAVERAGRQDTAGDDVYLGLAAPGPAGEFVVGGMVMSGAARGPTAQRLDATGRVVWARRFSTIGFDAVTAIAPGPDGVYVAGAASELVGPRSYGDQDMFVAVLDPATGAVVRAMQAGTAASDYPRDLAVAADGTVYLVGETLGALPGATAAGDYDVAVVRFAPDGAWTGAWQRGTSGDDTGRAIAVTPDAGVVIGGYTTGALVAGITPHGGRDGFVIHVAPGQIATP